MVDSRSRSLIRIGLKDKKQPTHAEVLRYLKNNYYRQTEGIVNNIGKFVTEDKICAILDKYNEVLSEKRKLLIKRFLLSKIEIMQDIYRKE